MAFKPETCLKFRALQDNCTIYIYPSKVDSSRYSFSTDGTNWSDDQITLNNGECAYVMGHNYPSNGTSSSNFSQFATTGECEIVSGNVMSLVDEGAGEQTDIDQECGFYNLFSDTKLKSIPANLLPATKLAKRCYQRMFQNCNALTTIPAGLLPAAELAEYCYSAMFFGCNSLTTIPVGLLPAIKLAGSCYYSMFQKCISLATIPANLLPATELTEYCYSAMFFGCDALTTIPVGLLPATELAGSCYDGMFCNCHYLTAVPKGAFMAKTFADSCCSEMFGGCRALKEIHVNFTAWPEGYLEFEDPLNSWVADVAATGDFYCPSDLPEERGTHRIHEGWTIHRYANKVRGSLNIKNLKMPIG